MIEVGFDQPEAVFGCLIAQTHTREEITKLLEDDEILSIHQNHMSPCIIETRMETSAKARLFVSWAPVDPVLPTFQ
jgi:hypothetical protein